MYIWNILHIYDHTHYHWILYKETSSASWIDPVWWSLFAKFNKKNSAFPQLFDPRYCFQNGWSLCFYVHDFGWEKWAETKEKRNKTKVENHDEMDIFIHFLQWNCWKLRFCLQWLEANLAIWKSQRSQSANLRLFDGRGSRKKPPVEASSVMKRQPLNKYLGRRCWMHDEDMIPW